MWTLFLLTMLGGLVEVGPYGTEAQCKAVAEASKFLEVRDAAVGWLCLAPAPEDGAGEEGMPA